MNILYVYRIDGFNHYLASIHPSQATLDRLQNNPRSAKIYFVSGRDQLVNCGPSWYCSVDAAIAAAEEMGFIVLGGVTPYSSLPR